MEQKSVNEVKSFDEFSGTQTTPPPSQEQAATAPAPQAQDRKRISVEMQDGVLVPKNIDEAWRMSSAFAASRMFGKDFDTPEKVFVALQYAYELGLKPVTAIRQIAVINGRPHVWGDLPLSLVMKSGKLSHLREYWFDKDGKEITFENNNINAEAEGYTCIVERLGMPAITRTFTSADAERAKLTGKDPWKFYRKRMLQCRARAWALKDAFPDVLSGVSIAEYDLGIVPEESSSPTASTTVSQNSRASALNAKFGKKEPEAVIDAETVSVE